MHEVQLPPLRASRYVSPASVEAALAVLDAYGTGARLVAGGTDLMLEMDRRVGPDVEVLVDLSRLAGLDSITLSDGIVHIGALVTHNQAATDPDVQRYGTALAQASLEVGSPALRNRATVVGNLVTASPANDTISALTALEAQVHIRSSAAERVVALSDFYLGVRRTVLEPNELVVGVSFEANDERRSVFVKAGLRKAQAISVVHAAVAAAFDDDNVATNPVIALGSVAPTIVRSSEAEAVVGGWPIDESTAKAAGAAAAQSVQPIDDLRGTADYRTSLVDTAVTRALLAMANGTHAAALPESPVTLGGPSVTPDEVPVELGPGDQLNVVVNGDIVSAAWHPGSALAWLHHNAGLSGTKEGCAEGECGACTVHLDGAAVLSCLVPAGRLHQSNLTTIEGLATLGQLHPRQQAFIDHAAVQCGYCIPGFLMAGAALNGDRAELTTQDIKLGLSGNLCRCTGYYAIEAAFGGRDDPAEAAVVVTTERSAR